MRPLPIATRYTLAHVAAFVLLPALLPIAARRASLDGISWIASAALAAWLLRRLTPRTAHLGVLFVVLAWLVFGVGLAQAGATALFLGSAWALGRQMLSWMRAATGVVASILTGTALWLALWGVLIHFPVNARALYIALCWAPLLWMAGETGTWREQWRTAMTGAHEWMRAIPFWSWAVGLIFIGWCLHWAWLPTLGYDDHALHLRFWTELLWQRRVSFDVQAQVWAVAPFASDLLHAGLSLMAGADVRGARNLALALAILLLLARMMRAWGLVPARAWLLLVLFASTPMLGNLLLMLQTELFLAVLALAGVAWLANGERNHWSAHLPEVLASAALCAATKLPGAVLGATLLAVLALQAWQHQSAAHEPQLRPCKLAWGVFLLALGFVALHSYTLAWLVTGNPLFPLYNGIFKSPYFPAENFSDTRYIHGFGLQSYVRAFFETSKFFEGGNFTAGWQYLLLLPPAALALLRRGAPSSLRLLAVPVFGFGMVMFAATQYWRYLFPVMPVASAMMAALFIGEYAQKKGAIPIILVLCMVCITLNIARFTKIAWVMHAPPALAWSAQGREKILQKYATEAFLTTKINQLAPGARVLYVPTPDATPAGAALFGTPLYANWYAPARSQRFMAMQQPADVKKFLSQEKVDFIIMPLDPSLAPGAMELLRLHMVLYGDALAQEGRFMLYRVREIPVQGSNIFSLRAQGLMQEAMVTEQQSKELATFSSKKAQQALYQVEFFCPSDVGFFIAQINWDKGAPYYRPLACSAQRRVFSEPIPVPFGASRGIVIATGQDTPWVQIANIAVDAR